MSCALVLEPPVSPADPDSLRRVCATYPTGVAIVSTLDEASRPCGLTINSFISVSLDPPLVLWSLSRKSPNLETFNRAVQGAITILAADQSHLAERFARPHPDKFADVAVHADDEAQAPVIDGGVAYLKCSPWSVVEAGDHNVYIWRVDAASVLSSAPPLMFHGGALRRGPV